MTHLDTLVNGALIVHWPLAGKIHREHGLQMREVQHPIVLFSGEVTIPFNRHLNR